MIVDDESFAYRSEQIRSEQIDPLKFSSDPNDELSSRGDC